MSFGDFFSGLGDDISSLFGGGSSTPTTPAVAQPGASVSGASGAPQDFSSFFTPGTFGSFTGPTAASGSPSVLDSAGGASTFSSPQTISQFLAPSAPSVVGAVGDGSSVSLPSNPYSDSGNASNASQSTVQQISSALGLGKVSTGDALKGAIGLGGLGYTALENSGSTSAEKALKTTANQEAQQGQQLESYLANGTLPPGAQSYVDQQTAAQKAAIQSKYASLGLSGSTAEIQELNNVDEQATAQIFNIANELYTNGVNQTGASGQLYNLLLGAQTADNAQIGTAINNFVTSLGGGGGSTVTLKTGS